MLFTQLTKRTTKEHGYIVQYIVLILIRRVQELIFHIGSNLEREGTANVHCIYLCTCVCMRMYTYVHVYVYVYTGMCIVMYIMYMRTYVYYDLRIRTVIIRINAVLV